MRVESVELYRYVLPMLVRPSREGETVPEREGLLLKIVSEQGTFGFGEIAPLPGFSDETLSEAQALAVAEALNLIGATVPRTFEELSLERRKPGFRMSSVAFGVEQGLASLSASTRSMALSDWISPSSRQWVPVNALLSGSTEQILEMAVLRMRAGFTAFKLKVGRRAIEEELDTVARVRDIIGTQSELRLDANRAWEYSDAVRFAVAILRFEPVFIEEPLRDPGELKRLHAETSVPIALDETVSELVASGSSASAPAGIDDLSYATAAILKPTLTGGLVQTHEWAERFSSIGVEPVLSSSFESEIGMSGLVALAAAVSGSGWAAGLDTLRYLDGSVLEETRLARVPDTTRETGAPGAAATGETGAPSLAATTEAAAPSLAATTEAAALELRMDVLERIL